MGHDSFDFKQFSIRQDRCAMKVGTDGVLLGAWTDVSCKSDQVRVLDIGTGTGLIALMIAQRLSAKQRAFLIDAIEIDEEAARQAQENIMHSVWHDGISVIQSSLQEFSASDSAHKIGSTEIGASDPARRIRTQEITASDPACRIRTHEITASDLACRISSPETRTYNLIVSNPPFYNATLKPDDEARAVARHKDSLPLSEITGFAKQHLSAEGTLNLIYPTDYDSEVMTAATLSGLHPIRICDVVTKKGKPCKRRMATFALPTHPQKDIDRQTLFIRNEKSEYTEDYLQLVDDFYLSLKSN